MVTRILHISDTHLGNRQYGSDTRRGDFANAFVETIDYALDEGVDAVIHTGDLFDTRNPSLTDINRCIDILQPLAGAGIPFYGVVGNHERKMDDQYLDLIQKTQTAKRLDKSPQLVNDEVAIYGIDAVTKPAWHAEDFTLEEPPDGTFIILCMHQLLHPPVPEIIADHSLDDVLDRVNINIDALALGDYHESEGTVESGTQVWYAGSTERCAIDEERARTVSLLEIEDGNLKHRQKELNTRDFLAININFAEGDDYRYAEDAVDRHDVTEKVVIVTLSGESTMVTSSDVRGIVMDRGAAVCRVDDTRGGPEIDIAKGPTGDVQSADRLIEEKLAEESLSDIAARIEEHVRTEEVTPSGFADEAEKMVMDAQDEAFTGQGTPNAAQEGEE